MPLIGFDYVRAEMRGLMPANSTLYRTRARESGFINRRAARAGKRGR
jgi:hypothetical protein